MWASSHVHLPHLEHLDPSDWSDLDDIKDIVDNKLLSLSKPHGLGKVKGTEVIEAFGPSMPITFPAPGGPMGDGG